MKQKFAEFLLKRIESKAHYLQDAASHDEVTAIADDIIEYLIALKEIITEVIKP